MENQECTTKEEIQSDKLNEIDKNKKENKRKNKYELNITSIAIMLIVPILFIFMLSYSNINTNLKTIIDEIKQMQIKEDMMISKIEYLENEIVNLQVDLKEAVESIKNNPINITISNDGTMEQEEILPPGFDTSPFLGVAFTEQTASNENSTGLRVDSIYQYSPAEICGIQQGDIITRFNGKDINNLQDLTEAMVECEFSPAGRYTGYTKFGYGFHRVGSTLYGVQLFGW